MEDSYNNKTKEHTNYAQNWSNRLGLRHGQRQLQQWWGQDKWDLHLRSFQHTYIRRRQARHCHIVLHILDWSQLESVRLERDRRRDCALYHLKPHEHEHHLGVVAARSRILCWLPAWHELERLRDWMDANLCAVVHQWQHGTPPGELPRRRIPQQTSTYNDEFLDSNLPWLGW